MKSTIPASLLACLAFAVVFLFAHTEANAQIRGQNVQAVKYSKAEQVQGFFTKLTEKTWTQVTPQSVKDGFWSEGTTTAEWIETHRDKWSVYLRAANDDARIQIDLWKKKVTLSQGGGKTELAESLEPFLEAISLAEIAKQTQKPETIVQGTATVTTTVAPETPPEPAPSPTFVTGQIHFGPCEKPGYYRDADHFCVIDVFYYDEPGLSLAAAQSISQENGWEVATADQVELAWKRLGLDQYALGMVADGRFAVPIQSDQPGFQAGPNIGATGGNQGFFYVKKPAVEVAAEPAAPSTPPAPETRTTIAIDPVTGQQSVIEIPVLAEGEVAPGSPYRCDYGGFGSNFTTSPDPRDNWMVDMWENPVSVSSNSLLVEAAVKLLENRGVAVTDAALQRLAAKVKSDPVTRYEFAPFMLGTFFDALVTDQPRAEQSEYRSYFEQYRTCSDLHRARMTLQFWNQYQGNSNIGSTSYKPNTLSVLTDTGPSYYGFSQSDPLSYGPVGGAAVSLLYLPMASRHELLPDDPLNGAVASIDDDMTAVAVGAGLGSAALAPAVLVGGAAIYFSSATAAVMSTIPAHLVTASAVPSNIALSAANLFIPAIVAVAAAAILGSTVADISQRAAFEAKLKSTIANPTFTVADYLNVAADQLETRRRALFALMVGHLVANPAEHAGLTIELPLSPGEYRIRLDAAGRHLNVNPNDASQFLSVAAEPIDNSGNFVFERLRNDSYRIWVKSSDKFLRVNSRGFPSISTSEQIADEFSEFRLRRVPDDSTYSIISAATGKHVHIDTGSAAMWANTQLQPDDEYTHFVLDLVDLEPNTLDPMGGNEFDRIQSAVYPYGYIHNQNGPLELGKAEPNWWSAMWKFVDVGNGFVRIQNRWYPDLHLHNQNGSLELGPIQPNWHSAMWKFEDISGSHVRIQSRWHSHDYLHVENGVVKVGRVDPDSRNTLWKVK